MNRQDVRNCGVSVGGRSIKEFRKVACPSFLDQVGRIEQCPRCISNGTYSPFEYALRGGALEVAGEALYVMTGMGKMDVSQHNVEPCCESRVIARFIPECCVRTISSAAHGRVATHLSVAVTADLWGQTRGPRHERQCGFPQVAYGEAAGKEEYFHLFSEKAVMTSFVQAFRTGGVAVQTQVGVFARGVLPGGNDDVQEMTGRVHSWPAC